VKRGAPRAAICPCVKTTSGHDRLTNLSVRETECNGDLLGCELHSGSVNERSTRWVNLSRRHNTMQVHYRGSARGAHVLVSHLEREGREVVWTRPIEQRSIGEHLISQGDTDSGSPVAFAKIALS
jgi:hypothetical protein